MTIWTPRLGQSTAPRYVAIADAIAHDIGSGALQPGDRLPTHRHLAKAVGVTVGTVTRGYAEAERRGLTVGEVGRGTFVRRDDSDDTRRWAVGSRDDQRVIDLALGRPVPFPRGEDEEEGGVVGDEDGVEDDQETSAEL